MIQWDYSAAEACFCSALWGSLLKFGPKDPSTRLMWTEYQHATENLQEPQRASKSLTQRQQAVWDIPEEPLPRLSRPPVLESAFR
jgi:hypothetical protein